MTVSNREYSLTINYCGINSFGVNCCSLRFCEKSIWVLLGHSFSILLNTGVNFPAWTFLYYQSPIVIQPCCFIGVFSFIIVFEMKALTVHTWLKLFLSKLFARFVFLCENVLRYFHCPETVFKFCFITSSTNKGKTINNMEMIQTNLSFFGFNIQKFLLNFKRLQ